MPTNILIMSFEKDLIDPLSSAGKSDKKEFLCNDFSCPVLYAESFFHTFCTAVKLKSTKLLQFHGPDIYVYIYIYIYVTLS